MATGVVGWCARHEEIELALVKLYHATGERRYLDLGGQIHYKSRVSKILV